MKILWNIWNIRILAISAPSVRLYDVLFSKRERFLTEKQWLYNPHNSSAMRNVDRSREFYVAIIPELEALEIISNNLKAFPKAGKIQVHCHNTRACSVLFDTRILFFLPSSYQLLKYYNHYPVIHSQILVCATAPKSIFNSHSYEPIVYWSTQNWKRAMLSSKTFPLLFKIISV